MDRFEIYINNELKDIVEKSYENYLEVKEKYSFKEVNAISNVIAITSSRYWEYGKFFWIHRFKNEEIVLNKIIKTNKMELEESDQLAINFAKWCVITQAFGIYGYEKALEVYKKENIEKNEKTKYNNTNKTP